jgi:chromosome segregation ATPase
MDATKETEVLRKHNMELESQLTAATIEPTKKWECSSKDCPTLRHYKEHHAAAETDVRKLNEKLIAADKYWKDRIASLEASLAAAEHRTVWYQDYVRRGERIASLEASLAAAEHLADERRRSRENAERDADTAYTRIAALEKRLEHMTKAHDLIQQSLQKKKEEVESLRAGVSIMKVVNNDIMEISEGEKVQIPSILDWNLELYARRDTRVTILTREPSGAVIYRIEPRYPYMNYFEDVEFLGQELKGPMPKRLVDLLKALDFYKREVEGLRQGGAKVLEESTKLLKENEELKKESEDHINAFRNETSLRIAEHEELERLRKMVK